MNQSHEDDAPKGPHHWHTPKRTSLTYCIKCGLIWLSNRITMVCIKAGCEYPKDPSYRRWVSNGRKW